MKTCPCNIQRFFSVVKIEYFTRKILIFFLIFAQNIDCGYRLWVNVRTAYVSEQR